MNPPRWCLGWLVLRQPAPDTGVLAGVEGPVRQREHVVENGHSRAAFERADPRLAFTLAGHERGASALSCSGVGNSAARGYSN